MCETTTLSHDMIALLDNVQILAVNKKLVNKLHSVGSVTSLWIGVTQRLTNEIGNFIACSNNPPQKHLRCKKGAPKKLQVPGTQCKKKRKNSSAEVKSNW